MLSGVKELLFYILFDIVQECKYAASYVCAFVILSASHPDMLLNPDVIAIWCHSPQYSRNEQLLFDEKIMWILKTVSVSRA